MSITTILIIAVIISGLMLIKAEYFGPYQQTYIFKPLTTFCILLIAVLAITNDPTSYFYKQMIVAGLFFSICGDVFLMLPSDRFIQGLVSFLIAHIFYIIAFSFNVPQSVPIYYIIPFLLYGILMFGILSPGLGRLRIPVIIYITVIMTMVFLAMNRLLIIPDKYDVESGNLYAFIGALFFMASDTILAINKFRYQTKVSKTILLLDANETNEPGKKVKFHPGQFMIMSTYYTAQVFIALSVK